MSSVDKNTQVLEEVERISRFSRQKYRILFIAALAIVVSGTIVWVLNIVDIIPGPWSTVFSAVFTGVGIVVALISMFLALPLSRGGVYE